MATISSLYVPIASAVQDVTLHVEVTGRRRFRARLWLGALMMRAAARVIGCNVYVGLDDADASA